jgi:hypothetical protein
VLRFERDRLAFPHRVAEARKNGAASVEPRILAEKQHPAQVARGA